MIDRGLICNLSYMVFALLQEINLKGTQVMVGRVVVGSGVGFLGPKKAHPIKPDFLGLNSLSLFLTGKPI